MNQSIVNALEQAFLEIRDRDATLAERLEFISRKIRLLSPSFADEVDLFVRRLAQVGAGNNAPRVGEKMPAFILPDDQGRIISLEKLLETGPVVIAFHRGHWCPYCRLNAAELAHIDAGIRPAQIIAISAETQVFTRKLKVEAGANFPFLTDIDNGYALSLNLAIWVDDAMSTLIAGAGWNVPSYQTSDGWFLPIPSTYVVGQDGLVKMRHVDPDYRNRVDIAMLHGTITSLLGDRSLSAPLPLETGDNSSPCI